MSMCICSVLSPFSISCRHFHKLLKELPCWIVAKSQPAIGEPLYMDVVNALNESRKISMPQVIGGRYGLASKEFTPAMVKAVFDELKSRTSENTFHHRH